MSRQEERWAGVAAEPVRMAVKLGGAAGFSTKTVWPAPSGEYVLIEWSRGETYILARVGAAGEEGLCCTELMRAEYPCEPELRSFSAAWYEQFGFVKLICDRIERFRVEIRRMYFDRSRYEREKERLHGPAARKEDE